MSGIQRTTTQSGNLPQVSSQGSPAAKPTTPGATPPATAGRAGGGTADKTPRAAGGPPGKATALKVQKQADQRQLNKADDKLAVVKSHSQSESSSSTHKPSKSSESKSSTQRSTSQRPSSRSTDARRAQTESSRRAAARAQTKRADADHDRMVERIDDLDELAQLDELQAREPDAEERGLQAARMFIGDEDKRNAFTAVPSDNFDPALDAAQIERLGSIQGAIHMVKLADHWQRTGLDRDAVIERTAHTLLGFSRTDQVKKMLGEMGNAPITHVYPLEVMLQILDRSPQFLPKVRRGELLENRSDLTGGDNIRAGQEFRLRYPADYKIKAFALLGGGQPGYEFAPHKNGIYRMVVDTPGDWTFALSAECKGETVVDTFQIHVREPGSVTLELGA